MRPDTLANLLRPHYDKNRSILNAAYGSYLTLEENALKSGCINNLLSISEKILTQKTFEKKFKKGASELPYCLFAEIYAGGYFSLKQAISIDSIRYAVDQALLEGSISLEQRRWAILGLAQVLSKVANTTGHFAQYLKLKEGNLARSIKQKKREVWQEWLNACDFLIPIGGRAWRLNNKVFNSCSLDILQHLSLDKEKPTVIYADPPYTSDQYSRFYHIYETLFGSSAEFVGQ